MPVGWVGCGAVIMLHWAKPTEQLMSNANNQPHPWDRWWKTLASRGRIRLTRGRHFASELLSMAVQVRRQARLRGTSVQVSTKDQTIIITLK